MSAPEATGYVVDVHGHDRRKPTFRWCGNATGEDEAKILAGRAARLSWTAATAATGSPGEPFPNDLGIGAKVVKRPGWAIDLQWHPKDAMLKAMRDLRPSATATGLDLRQISEMIAAIAMGDPSIGPEISTGERDAIIKVDVKGTGHPPHLLLAAGYDDSRKGPANPSPATAEAILALGTIAAIHDAQQHERLAEKRVGAPKSAILRATLALDADRTRREIVAPAAALLRQIGADDLAEAVEMQTKWN